MAVYKSPYCTVSAEPGLTFETPSGQRVLNGISLSYSSCTVHCLNALPDAPDRLLLDHTAGLRAGDAVLITNSMYGGGSRVAYQKIVHIMEIAHHEITFAPALPEHMMRYTKGLFVLNRGPTQSVLAKGGRLLNETDGGATLACTYECGDIVCHTKAVITDENPRIDLHFSVEFLRPCRLFNLSLVFDSGVPLHEAFLKNRTVRDLKANPPKHDLWLWKEGCRASEGDAGWTVLHTPSAASCEIVTRGRGYPFKTIPPESEPVFVVNFEHYNAQHFRRHCERFTANFSTFEEISLPTFETGDRREYTLSMHVGDALPAPPRLMLAPSGYRAVNVWTEHADKTTIETHRAAYFGSESITRAEDSTGGFVKHSHVVTKSIFCENPNNDANQLFRDGASVSVGPMLALAESEAFGEMLDQLAALGHEICVHANRPHRHAMLAEGLAEAIDPIYRRFGSPTWIDHALESIEYCAGFQGLVPYSECCMIDAWVRNGVRFFWTWSSADFMPKTRNTIDLLHNDGDGAMPTPLYWRHPVLPEGAVIWGANECPLDYFSDQTIDQLIHDRGVSIQQHYYPFLICDHHSFGFLERDENGRYRATDQFNRMLAHMARRRDEGELMITTIGTIVAYWLGLEGIKHTLMPPNSFELTNTRDQAVPDLAFVVRAAGVESDQISFNQRELDSGDMLIWFDMPAQERIIFKTIPRQGTPPRTNDIDWLLDEERGFVLFFRPRCGSTTLTRWFFENNGVVYGGFSIAAHRNEWLAPRLEHLQQVLDQRYDELHKFVVIRDPIERAVSSYLHVVNNPADSQWDVVKPFVDSSLGKHDLTFRQWVEYLGKIDLDTAHIIWRRQSVLSCWERGVDDVVVLEKMNEYLLEMNRRFGLSAKPTFNSVTVPESEKTHPRGLFRAKFFGDVPFRNLLKYKGKAYFERFPDYSQFYDRKLRSTIEDLYHEDIHICQKYCS